MTDQPSHSPSMACPHCRQSISADARKCYHCGESLTERSALAQWTRKTMALVGIITGLLSLFFGLKEGYFFIKERQEQRAMATSYLEAAEHFIDLDSLTYAEQSLEKALSASPNDLSLRTRVFFLRVDHFLREADYFGSQFPDERLVGIPDMVLEGFSLLSANLPSVDKARLLTALGRLLQYDRRWQSEAGVKEVFEQARKLTPQNPETLFWSGAWLQNSDDEAEQLQGKELIQQAVHFAPQNPVYSEALGRILVKQHQYKQAFQLFIQAIESKPDQRQLQRIRAANEAKRSLAFGLIEAHELKPIMGEEFFGLSMDERLGVIRHAVQNIKNRRLAWVAAQFFYHLEDYDRAEAQMRMVLGQYDARSPADQLVMLSKILAAQGKQDEQQMVDDMLAVAAERQQYDEVLELGQSGQHQFKVGLKVNKRSEGEGVQVVKSFGQYPFHKAGVRAGDRLIEFGHRKVNNMSDILNVIYGFSPGADVPLKLIRDDKVVELVVVIE